MSIIVDDIVVGEVSGFARFAVRLTKASAQPISVDYTTGNMTAGNGSDYTGVSGTLTFSPGQTVLFIDIPIIANSTAEFTESFALYLSNAVNSSIGKDVAIATIIDNDAPAGTPVIKLADQVVDETAGTVSFVITLSKASTGVVTVDYATMNGSAKAGGDYTALGLQKLTFLAGEVSKTVTVSLKNDGAIEAGEYFDLVLSNVVGATLPDNKARVFIGASDQAAQTLPVLSVAHAQADEGDGYIDFVVSLSGPSAQAVTVNYGTGNATAGVSDYDPQSGTLVFEAGETTKIVRVGLDADGTPEFTENFFLFINGASGASIGNDVAVGTIIDNDGTAGTPVIKLGDVVVDEKDGRAYVTVTLDRPGTGTVSVNYVTANGTATSGADYEAQATQTLTFAAGEMTKTIIVNLGDDAAAEGGESFDIVFSGVVGATLPDNKARVFIGASDQAAQTLPVLSVAHAQADEGDGYIDFVVSLSGPSAQAVTVNYGTGNATAGVSDYDPQSGTLVFEAGETTKIVRVGLDADGTPEFTENFFLFINGASGASIGNDVAVGTIIDNDGTAGTPVIKLGDVVVDEKDGRAYVTVTLDRPGTGTVSVNYVTANGTATSGADYEAQATQTLTFAAGEMTKTIIVNLGDDAAAEGGESFDIVFSGVVGATLPDNKARVFIGASDQAAQTLPVLSVAHAQADEGDGYIDFVVSLSGPSAQAVTVNYGTGNATAGVSDYDPQSGTLVFEAGETTKIVRVGLDADGTPEFTENFFLFINGASGASIGNDVAVGTIIDNDGTAGTPVIKLGDVVVDEKDGRAYVTVTLDRPGTGTVSVNYVTANGTATSGADYEAQATQTLTFAAGEMTKTIIVNLGDDATVEPTGEVFDVVFSAASGASLPDKRAHVVISPNDMAAVATPKLTVSPPVVSEGGSYIDFIVSLSGRSTQAVSVNYTTGNATAGVSDYDGQSGSLVFEAGETVKVVRVGLGNNVTAESLETFLLLLSGATGATIGTPSITARIVDDDPASAAGLTVVGTAGADVVRGLATADTLTGAGGNDVLDGGDGADKMSGGSGNDTYLVEQAGDTVTEAMNAGTDTVISYLASYTLGANVENLVLASGAKTGIGNLLDNAITGSTGANTLDGQAGNDVLDGRSGADTMIGGTGGDIYVVDNVGDVVTEGVGAGTDTVRTSISLNAALATNVEKLELTGSATINGIGNALANTLTGNGAANTLDGGASADTMIGGLGDDLYVVDNAADVVTELAGQGVDRIDSSVSRTLEANVENLSLTGVAATNAFGNGLANVLVANSAANILRGLGGVDTMTGGGGPDTFDFNKTTETGVGDGLRDIITDFVSGLDKIDFSGIDANLGLSGNDAFVNIGADGFSGAGQLRYQFDGTNTLIQGNVGGSNGDAVDFEVLVLGDHQFPSGGFDVIL